MTGAARIAHVDLVVARMAGALRFFRDGLGFEVVEDAGLSGDVPTFLSGGRHDALRAVLFLPPRAAP